MPKSAKRPVIVRIGFGGYSSSYVVAVGATQDQILRFLQRETYEEAAIGVHHRCTFDKCWRLEREPERRLELEPHEAARAVGSDCGDYLMLLRTTALNAYSISTLTHEALHLVQFLTRRLGATMNEETAEFFAYMLGDIVHEVVRLLGMYDRNGRRLKGRKR